ncbi:MAG: zf-HC2 domain-containing protein [Candidatus Sulfotelmatobacter sp.]
MRQSIMDHDEAVRHKTTEKYLLGELDPELKDQFEEHLFDCQDCALDVRAAAVFVEQSKAILSESAVTVPQRSTAAAPRAGWLAWFRPSFAVPVLALLLAVVGYQNLVTYPHLMQAANQPQVGPWASINVSTRGATPIVIKARRGEGFSLLINLPPEDGFASYAADLYNPAQKLEWSGPISSTTGDEGRQIYIPGRNHQPGTYTLVILGITSGESKEISRHSIDLQIQN